MARQHRFYVRLDEKELARLKRAAERLGMSRSDYVRFISQLPAEAFSVPEEGKVVLSHFVFFDTQTAHRILIEASRWGTNYNQGVHALNRITTYLRTRNPEKHLDEMLGHSEWARVYLDMGKDGIVALVDRLDRLKNARIIPIDTTLEKTNDALP